jgi:hypothetical protein
MVLKEKVNTAPPTLKITAITLTSVLTGLTITDSSTWYISSNCERFAVANRTFKMNPAKDGFVALTSKAV